MLYEAYQAQRDLTAPARAFAGLASWTLAELPDRFRKFGESTRGQCLLRPHRLRTGESVVNCLPVNHGRPRDGGKNRPVVSTAGEH
jgi:hypothetical protein